MAYLLDDIENLLAQVRVLGARYQQIIPEPVQQEARLLDLHGGPNAWRELWEKYRGMPGLDGVTTLGVIAQQIEGLLIRERAKGTEPNLSLTKHRPR